jgi:erythromycin esterase-like protein
VYYTLDDWIQHEAIPFSLDSPEAFNASIDEVISPLDRSVELLGFGEALHGGEDLLMLRNRIFQRLVEAHGFSAIAIESSFPRARAVNGYITGQGPDSYEGVELTGFSHGFGQLAANKELVEWMRSYNAEHSHRVKLHFYGFDGPLEMMYADSPRHLLHFVLDYLSLIDGAGANERRERIDPLLGNDPEWENPAAAMDPTMSIGTSPGAAALRIETEDLISLLIERRPELVAKTDHGRFAEAHHYASEARELLNYHARIARQSADRLGRLLGVRDAMMADILAYMVSQERGRGRVLAFAHNSHLKRGKAHMQLGPYALTWWPAGAAPTVRLRG